MLSRHRGASCSLAGRRAIVTSFALVALYGCTSEAPPVDGPLRITVGSVDTLVSEENAILQLPGDVVSTPEGSLLALDWGSHEILELDLETRSVKRRYGRRGRGPGDLNFPLGLFVVGDTITTSNSGNKRLERYLRDGTVLPSRRPIPEAFAGRIAFDAFGGYVVSTNGVDTSLVSVFDSRDSLATRLGTPVVPPTREWRFGEYKAAVIRGEVPDYFRNGTISAAAADSSVWVAHYTQPLLERYSRRGELLVRVTLEDSVVPRIYEQFKRRNVEDSASINVHQLYYVMDLSVEGDQLWVLLNAPPKEPAVLLQVTLAGEVVTRVEIPGATAVFRIAAVPARRELVLVSTQNAEIYRIKLPDSVWSRGSAR